MTNRGRLKVLLLGSFHPPRQKYGKTIASQMKKCVTKYNRLKKIPFIQNFFELNSTKLMLVIKHKFQRIHSIWLGDLKLRREKDLYERLLNNMKNSDVILILLCNHGRGGVLVEHGMCMAEELRDRTIDLIHTKREHTVSNFIRYGTLAYHENIHYKDASDLLRKLATKLSRRRLDKIVSQKLIESALQKQS